MTQSDQMAQTDMREAAEKLGRILKYLTSDPNNRELLATAIDLHLRAGQIDDAWQRAKDALALYPDDPFFQHRLGNVLIAMDSLEEAEMLFEQLRGKSSDSAIAYSLAYVYFCQRRYLKVRDVLLPYAGSPTDPIEESGKLSPAAVALLLRALHHAGKVKDALEVAKPYLAAWPGDPDILAVASLLYLDDGQMEEARRCSLAAQSAGVYPIEALVTGGTVALGTGDVDAANMQFSKALEMNPKDGRTWSGLGLSSMLNQDLVKATEQLEKAVAYMPEHIGTWQALGWCKLLGRDLAGAETLFRKALALDRNFAESYGCVAVVAALKGDVDIANESIARAVRLNPSGMAAKYAQMVLSGEAQDPAKIRALALQLFSTGQGAVDQNFAEIMARASKK